MTRKPGAPVPAEIRGIVRAKAHPARSVPCPRCSAAPHRPCTTPSKRRRITDAPVHPSRISAWVRLTACCPACQVEPGIDCHADGWPLQDRGVHPQREAEARGVAA